ncbi:carotenoid 1,2-hydratase [Paraburkholderia sp. BCC1885]|uniref:lipocalin-like domain-containing protein n=1 Tax=Paraburkholderia sp. BCC1885 TaxID=2562669 RepID=UPI0021B19BF6|nr:carotenoid 1,2-hydratase [Paraburkholderia sp. BCC1885]
MACILISSPAVAAPPQFAAVTSGHALMFPADMGAHPAFRTEWWYVTGWLNTPDGKPLGFQITFFRSATDHDAADPSAFAPTQLIIAHAALSDPAFGKLVHDQRVARQGFGLAYAKPGNTDLKLDNWRMLRAADGHYTVAAQAGEFALNLSFAPTQAPLLQGQQGYSQKGPLAGEASYYYSEPQLRVSGSVTRPSHAAAGNANAIDDTSGSRPVTPVDGVAWLDHEWSSTLLSPDSSGWDWLGANFPDGSALMAFKVRGRNGGAVWAHAALRDASGTVTAFDPAQVDFVPQRTWRSPRTNTVYPVAEAVKAGAMTWQLEPLLDDQEMDTRESTGSAYWEGAVTVTRAGQGTGRGYLELTGYQAPLTLQDTLKAAR